MCGFEEKCEFDEVLGGTTRGAAVVVLKHQFAAVLWIMWDALARIEIRGDKAKFY